MTNTYRANDADLAAARLRSMEEADMTHEERSQRRVDAARATIEQMDRDGRFKRGYDNYSYRSTGGQQTFAKTGAVQSYTHVDIETLPVTINGVSMDAAAAKDAFAKGFVSRDAYKAAIEAAARVRDPGFKLQAVPAGHPLAEGRGRLGEPEAAPRRQDPKATERARMEAELAQLKAEIVRRASEGETVQHVKDQTTDDGDKADDAEDKPTKTPQQVQADFDAAWSSVNSALPGDARAAAFETYIESGAIHEAVTGPQADAIEAGIRAHVEAMVEPLGIDTALWSHFVADNDLPAYRRAVMTNDRATLMTHAKAVAETVYSGKVDAYLADQLRDTGHKVTEGDDGRLMVQTSKGPKPIAYAIQEKLVRIRPAY